MNRKRLATAGQPRWCQIHNAGAVLRHEILGWGPKRSTSSADTPILWVRGKMFIINFEFTWLDMESKSGKMQYCKFQWNAGFTSGWHFLFGQICLKICANKKRRSESDLSTSSFVLGVCSIFSRRNQCPKLRTPLRAGFRRPSLWLSDMCEYLNHLGKSKILLARH